jgi:hypothetical protein
MHPASITGGLSLDHATRGLEQLLRYGEGVAPRGAWTQERDEELSQNREAAMTQAGQEDAHYGHQTHAHMLLAVTRDRKWNASTRGAVLGRAVKGQAQALRELAITSISGRAL